MTFRAKWRELGWRHPLWEYVRFLSNLGPKQRQTWEEALRSHRFEVGAESSFPVPEEHADVFFEYCGDRLTDAEECFNLLRSESEAISHCRRLELKPKTTRTKSKQHHQSSTAVVTAVTHLAEAHCRSAGHTVVPRPSKRCVWHRNGLIHIAARRIDGAIPSLNSPKLFWEIKEYWGKTSGGSKMSDAVYEAALIGLELRLFEDRSGHDRVDHVVFIDGRAQWESRRSDINRFVDLFHQGLIDHLIVGREIESAWEELLITRFPPIDPRRTE